MKHFELIEWTDFVRGLVEQSARVAMERHLASGCRKCRHTADLLRKAAVAARSDSKVQVPEYAVRFARAIFILQLPEKVRLLPRALARLLYDCFREPLPVGVRSQQGLSRRALYQAGDYLLDVRLENEGGSSRVGLVGQIQNRKEPGKRLGGVLVLLVSGKQILAQAVSNSLGEFQMEHAASKRLRLYMLVRQAGKQIEVSLSRPLGLKAKEGTAAAKKTPFCRKEQ
ncbi:MAG TPA: hypothetical protein VJK29_21995 [Terriglobales bacterium]|nr:hypothetical protein [Terriglobales bacterium]